MIQAMPTFKVFAVDQFLSFAGPALLKGGDLGFGGMHQ